MPIQDNFTRKDSSDKNWIHLALCIPTSILSFLLTQNFRILNPRHVGWLLNSGDSATSLTQWTYFRKTPIWQWPVTLNKHYGYPWAKTIIYADTAPLFAVPLKFLLGSVDGLIQFIGFQILFSTFLMIVFTSLCVQAVTRDALYSQICGLSISTTPVLLFRDVFTHYSMNIMWVIPAAMHLIISNQNKNRDFYWGLLSFVTLTWMPYFLVHVLILLVSVHVAIGFAGLLTWRRIATSFNTIFIFCFAAMTVNGFWYNRSSSAQHGLDFYNANLLALINPKATENSDWSSVLPGFDNATDGQYEGFAFLGLGIFIMFFISVILAVFNWHDIVRLLENRGVRALLLATGLGWLLSLGFSLDFGTNRLFKLEVPPSIISIFSIFRSSGRFMMLTALAIALLTFLVTHKFLRRKIALGLLITCTLSTIVDSRSQILANKKHQSISSFGTEFDRAKDFLATNDIGRVVFISPENSAYFWKMSILVAAASRNIPANDGFFARPNDLKLTNERDRTIADFQNSFPIRGELWVVYPEFGQTEIGRLLELKSKNCWIEIQSATLISWKKCGS